MDNLKEAFYQTYAGEAKAALRLKVYAEKAEDEGYSQIACLFRAIARSEEIHGSRSLRMLGTVKSTEENLMASFESETSVAAVAYKDFLQIALKEGKENDARIFSQSRDVEETHAKLYKDAMNSMLEGRELTYHICLVCGYIIEGQGPGKCPICYAPKEKFQKFECGQS